MRKSSPGHPGGKERGGVELVGSDELVSYIRRKGLKGLWEVSQSFLCSQRERLSHICETFVKLVCKNVQWRSLAIKSIPSSSALESCFCLVFIWLKVDVCNGHIHIWARHLWSQQKEIVASMVQFMPFCRATYIRSGRLAPQSTSVL